VLSYIPGQWLFLAAVSSFWRDMYSRLTAIQLKKKSLYMQTADFTCVPQMTLYSSVFASPARVKYAHASGVSCSTADYQFAAGRHATVAALITAREVGMYYTVVVMVGVADCNTLPVMQFLHAQGCHWDETVTSAAAASGAFQMLQWAHEHGCLWREYCILNEAASSGNVEMMAWVKQQPGVVCNQDAMDTAAQKGRTAVCEYLHAEQCPWSVLTCYCAAVNGHVHTLQWLHDHGCPWHPTEVCTAAAAGGSVDTMMYLQQQGIVFTAALLTHLLNAAGSHDKLAAAQWLRQQGAEWPAVLRYSFSSWSKETLAWARSEDCTSYIYSTIAATPATSF
jgi:hypothetical protein